MKVLFAKLPFSEEGKLFTKRILFSFCILLLMEICIFNLKSFTTDKEEYGIEFSMAQTSTPETVEILEDGICFHGDGEVIFDVERDVNAIQLFFSGEDQRFLCSAAITDDNFSQEFIVATRKYTSCDYGKFDTSFLSYGELKKVKISFSEVNSDIFIDSGEFSTVLPFHFSWVRFLSLFALAVLLCGIMSFQLYTYDYHRNSVKQQRVIGLLLMVSILFLCSFYNPKEKAIKYVDSDLTYSDPYLQMFDSFHEGRLSLKAEATEQLADLDNPYDRSLRESVMDRSAYCWDRAYYEGQYYSYFGATPVFVFYYPFYLISGGYLPTPNMACLFFGILATVFMYKMVLSFIHMFLKKVNFLLLCAILASSLFTSGIVWLVNDSYFYVVPCLASTCFLFLCLWTGISACGETAKYKQCLLFAICGLSFVLCFESRATKAFSALILAPLFIGVLLNKKLSVKRRGASVASFIVPVALGLAAIMTYNYARFASPFEFGSTYQLTQSDIHANKMTWKLFMPAMMHFFLQPGTISNVFPFFNFTVINTENYGKYICSESSVGILVYPLLCLGILIFPFLMYSLRRNKKQKYTYNGERIRNYTCSLMMILIVFVSWMDFCLGGIVIRYVTDIMPLATLLSAWCFMETYGLSEKVPALKKKVLLIFGIAAFLTVLLGYCQVLWRGDGETIMSHPTIISVLEELICFWN